MIELEAQSLGVTGEPRVKFPVRLILSPVQAIIEQVLDVPETEEIILKSVFDRIIWPICAARWKERRTGSDQDDHQGSHETVSHEEPPCTGDLEKIVGPSLKRKRRRLRSRAY